MNKLVFVLFSVCILLSSCHALVEDEFPDFAKVPVMNGLLQADSTFRVQVSLTANLTDTAPTYVSNARVIIESTIATPDTLVYTEKGWYVSERTVKAGASYTCRAEIQGFSTVSASTFVPLHSEIGEVIYTDLASRGEEGEKISSFEFTIANNKIQRQYWLVQLVSEGLQTDFNPETNEFFEYYGDSEEYIYMLAGQDSVLLYEANPLTLFSNNRIKGDSYKVKFYLNSNYTNLDDSNYTPILVIKSVDESYYRYVKQYYIYESAQYPDIGQSNQKYPMYSNVKNGLGLFTGLSVTRKEIAFKELSPNP